MFGPSGYLANPSPSPVHAWNGSTCVLIYKNGTSGGAFLTAKHTGGTAAIDINGSGEGTAYNVTARYEHPDYDVALLITDADVSALPTVTLANAVPDKTGTVIKRIAGWGRTLTALGGSPIYHRAERWARGYSVDRNIPEDIKPLNWSVQYDAGVSTSGVAVINDSGGACFADGSYTLEGWITGSDYTSLTSGQTAVSVRAWVQSILSNPSAPFITKAYFDRVNSRARLYFNVAIDWISAGSKLYLADHDGTIYVDDGNAYGGGSLTGVTFVDLKMTVTGSRGTGGAAIQTFDLATSAFSQSGGDGNVAITESQFLDFPESDDPGEVIPMGSPQLLSPITHKLGHNGTGFSNTEDLITVQWDQTVSNPGLDSPIIASGDPFGRNMQRIGMSSTSGTTSTAILTVSGSRTFGSNLIQAAAVYDVTETDPSAQYSDQAMLLDWGPDLTITNGVASFASTNISNLTRRARSVTSPYTCMCAVAAGGAANAGVDTRVNNAATTLKGSAVTGTTVNTFQVTASERFGVAHLNTSGGTLSVSTSITFLVGTPSVTNATSTGNGDQTTSGLVIQRAGTDDSSVDYFKITSITGGTLYQNDGSTTIANNDFITYAQGQAGLKFTPDNDTGGSFVVTASRSNDGLQLSASTATATVTVQAASANQRLSRMRGNRTR